jgi:membrane protein involved in colicin uptake
MAIDINSVDPLYKDAVTRMRTAGIPDEEISTFLSDQAAAAAAAQAELDTYNAQAEAARLADEQSFQRAQAELDSLAQQERDVIMQQQAQFDAMQRRLQEEAAAAVEASRVEQERLAAEKKVFEEKAAAQAEKTRIETEGFQRTNAEQDVARKRAGRSVVARPLLAGATAGPTASTLGVGGGMTTGGSLGTTGTLGVG